METSLHKTKVTLSIFDKIEKWGAYRNFYGEGGATIQGQFTKLIEEVGELAGNLARGKDITDDIGDAVVVLTHLAKLNGSNIEYCIEHSYNQIKDRKGKFQNGSFIKESDLK